MVGINDEEKTKLRNPTFFENMKAKLGDLNYRVQNYLIEKMEKPVSEKFKNRQDNNQDINKLSILEKVYAKLNGTDHKGHVEEQERKLNQEKLAAELKNKKVKEISNNVIKAKVQAMQKQLNPSKSSTQASSSSFSPHDTPTNVPNTNKRNSGHGIGG